MTARSQSPLKAVPGSPPTTRRPRKAAPAKAPKPPETVLAAAETGDDREVLVRMRRRVAMAIDDPATLPRDLAALTRRIQEIVKEIAAFDARSGEGTGAGRSPAPDESFDASAL